MKRIPITAAKEISKKFDASIVAIVAWDGKTGKQHVTTYGITTQECIWAAELGNLIKRDVLNWPEEECHAKPARAKSVFRTCETCGKRMELAEGVSIAECSKCDI